MKKLLLFFATIFLGSTLYAQTPGCAGAVNLNFTPLSGVGSPEDTTIDYGCVTATGQFIWYGYFTVCQSGTLTVGGVVNTSGNDADITVWGPFTTTTGLCPLLTTPNIAGCGATPVTDYSSLGTVNQGAVYMVAVSCDSGTQIPTFVHNGTAVITGFCLPSNCFPAAGFESLCVVTVDSATQEFSMVWNELAGNAVSHFGILKADYMGVFQEIDTVHLTSLSEYIDVSADPNVHTEQYAIRTYDTCGTFWEQTGAYIQPVFCQSSLSTQGTVNVSWSPYIDILGNGPAYYVIYRGATPANMVSIDTVGTFVNSYTDINPLVGTSYYKIGTALYSSCVPMRLQQSAQSQYQVQSYSNASPITVVGIGENSLQEVSLFPNPSDGNITLRNLNAVSVLKVYDLAGRVVVQQQVQANGTQQISLENLESGIYSLTIENETGFFREEVVIRH